MKKALYVLGILILIGCSLRTQLGSEINGAAGGILIILLYFLPYLVAKNRQKSNTQSIFILNMFLGWTFIGWVVALIWAVSEEKIKTQ